MPHISIAMQTPWNFVFVFFLDRGPNRGRYGDFTEDGPQRGGSGFRRDGNQRDGSFANRDDRYGNYSRRGNEARPFNTPPEAKPSMHGKDDVGYSIVVEHL